MLTWFLISLLIICCAGFAAFYQGDLPQNYLEEKYATQDSKFINVSGLRTHYQVTDQLHDKPNKSVLLLLHGTGASLHTWDGWVEHLAQHFVIIRLDLPAFGLTGPNQQRDYSIEYYVDFVDTFIQQLNIEKFSIAGNSLGGAIAWNYAATHQERIEKLILLNASGVPKNDAPMIFSIARNPIGGYLLRHISSKAFIRQNLEQVYSDHSKISDSLVERYWELGLRQGNRQAFVDRAQMSFNYSIADTIERLSKIKSPTLIIWGEDDSWIPVKDAKFFESNIINSQTIVYPLTGHVPMEEIPEQTATDSLAFLRAE
ncbi:alpha/beta fold hydrolase [Aliikangiella marina]|nr:alpha/beta hydrolase [Aliikangiella marina]